MPAYSSGVLHWRAAEAAMVARSGNRGTGDVVVVADRGCHRERRQALRDVSAADQRYPAIGGGQPELAAGAGAGQESAEALGGRLLGVPVAGRMAERRGRVRVQAAQRDTAGHPAVAGSADHVAIANHDLGHRAVARDKHQRAGAARCSSGPGPRSRAAVPDVTGIWRLPGRGHD
jgi:hypothetical protein